MTAVTPVLMHWSYCSLALSQRNDPYQKVDWIHLYKCQRYWYSHQLNRAIISSMNRKKNISFWDAIQLSIWPDSAICHSCQNGFGKIFMGEVLLKTQSFCLRTTIEYSCIPVIQTQYTNKMLQIYNMGTEYSRQWIDGLVQYCSISIANALEILQCCTKPSKYSIV